MRRSPSVTWWLVLALAGVAVPVLAVLTVTSETPLADAAAGKAGVAIGRDELLLIGGYSDRGLIEEIIRIVPRAAGQPLQHHEAGVAEARAFPGVARITEGRSLHILVAGGSTNTVTPDSSADLFRLTSINGGKTFTSDDLPGLPEGVSEASMGTLDNRAFIAGGFTNSNHTLDNLFEIGKWGVVRTLAPMPLGTAGAAAVFDDVRDEIYVLGGYNHTLGFHCRTQIYDLETNSWSRGADMPVKLLDATAAMGPNGKIHVFGGFVDGYHPTDRVLVYDLRTNQWGEGPKLPQPLGGATAVAQNGEIFVVGGADDLALFEQILRFTFSADEFTAGEDIVTRKGNVFTITPRPGSGESLTIVFGQPGDTGVMGDWNADGVDTVGVFKGGSWKLRNSNSAGAADLSFNYGSLGWLPLTGDWNADGRDTVGGYWQGTFFLRNLNSTGPAQIKFKLGVPKPGWLPVAGDWDGDGKDTVGYFDPQTSTYRVRNSLSNGPYDVTYRVSAMPVGSKPVTGDWSYTGADQFGACAPTGNYCRLDNAGSVLRRVMVPNGAFALQ
jgi:hypothetical protein